MTNFKSALISKCFHALLCTLILSNSSLFAKEYFIDPQKGSDSYPGTILLPWKTITKANNILVPGDIVFLREGVYKNQSIEPRNSGTANDLITFQAYQNEVPTLSNVGTAIKLISKSYIKIKGIHVNGGGVFKSSTVKHWAKLDNAHYNIVEDCDFRYSVGWHGVLLENISSYNKFLNNYFDYCGTWSDNKTNIPGQGDDTGDLFYLKCGRYNLIEGNTMKHGGHDIIVVDDKYNVIRNNIFDGDWSDWGNGADIGTRAASFSARVNKNCSNNGTTEDDAGGYNIIEYNVFKNSRWFPDNINNISVKLFGVNQIFRYNIVADNIGNGISMATRNVHPYVAKNKIYNNIIMNNTWSGISMRDYKDQGYSMKSNIFKNNIYYNNGNNPYNRNNEKQTSSDQSLWLIWLLPDNPFENTKISNNLFFNNSKTPTISVKNAGGNKALDYHHVNNSKYVFENIISDPEFVEKKPSVNDKSHFKLKNSSKAIDKGSFLTKTVNSGNGTVIKVEDAGYFFDGFGVTEGDLIKIGNNSPVRIINIDYKKNTLVVSKQISWTSNSDVSLNYFGESPDIGLYEFGFNELFESKPEIQVTDAIDFGDVILGKTYFKEIEISNTGDESLIISDILLPAEFDVDWRKDEVKPGQVKKLKISFQPKTLKKYSEKLIIKSNDGTSVKSVSIKGNVTAKNHLPVIKILSPTNNERLISGSEVLISTSAEDSDGQIKKVQFFLGDYLLGEVFSKPFELNWKNIPTGQHTITCKAFDDDNTFVATSINILSEENKNDEVKEEYITNYQFSPIHDSYLQKNRNVNNIDLRIEHNRREVFLQFNIEGLKEGEVVDQAQIELIVDSDPGRGILKIFSGSHSNWTEFNLTAVNKPLKGDLLYEKNDRFNRNSMYSFDVSKAIKGNGKLSFVITMEKGGNDVSFMSKENSIAPKLNITTKTTVVEEDVVDTNKPKDDEISLSNFMLIDASLDKDVRLLKNLDTINFMGISSNEINFRYDNTIDGIKSVLFYLNGELIQTENVAPFAVFGNKKEDYRSWTPNPGSYVLEAKVFSESRGSGTLLESEIIEFLVIESNLESFSIIYPYNGSKVETNSEITIKSNIPNTLNKRYSESYKDVVVEFFANDTKIGEVDHYPYEIEWSTFTEGNYLFSAIMKNNIRVEVAPKIDVKAIKVNNLVPEIEWINSSDNIYKYTRDVKLQTSVLDKDGKVTKVLFYNDSILLGEVNKVPYSYIMKAPLPGYYNILAKAYDDNGDESISEILKFTVLLPNGDLPFINVDKDGNPLEIIVDEELENIPIDLEYWPNPVDDILKIECNYPKEATISINIINAEGKREIINGNKVFEPGQKIFLNMSPYKKGIYIVELIIDERIEFFKVLKN